MKNGILIGVIAVLFAGIIIVGMLTFNLFMGAGIQSIPEPELTPEVLHARHPDLWKLFSDYDVPDPKTIEETTDASGFSTAIQSIRVDEIRDSLKNCFQYKYTDENGKEYGLLVHENGYGALVCRWGGELLTGFG